MTIGETVRTPTGREGELIAQYPIETNRPARAEIRIVVHVRDGTKRPRPVKVNVLYALTDVLRCNQEAA